VTTPATTHTWEIAWDGGGWGYEPVYYPTGVGLFAPGVTANRGDVSNARLTKLIAATHAPGTAAQALPRMFAYEVDSTKVLLALFLLVTGGFQAN
jgi:hypothetical protein